MIVSGTVALIILGGLIGVAAVLFWPYVVSVFADHIIPFFRSTLGGTFGATIADGLATLVSWLDGKVILVRSAATSLWRLFKHRILGMKATYRKTTATSATVKSEAIVTPDGTTKFKQTVEEREVPLSDLPDEIRQQLESGAAVEVDMVKTVAQRVAEQALRDDIPIDELDLRL